MRMWPIGRGLTRIQYAARRLQTMLCHVFRCLESGCGRGGGHGIGAQSGDQMRMRGCGVAEYRIHPLGQQCPQARRRAQLIDPGVCTP